MRQLLCTFSNRGNYSEIVNKVTENYVIIYKKIFVFEIDSEDMEDDIVISYNIEKNPNTLFLANTILVHRKQDSNTMYSINALNELIKENNDGYLDAQFQLNWSEYQNMLVIIRDRKLLKINTKIVDVIQH